MKAVTHELCRPGLAESKFLDLDFTHGQARPWLRLLERLKELSDVAQVANELTESAVVPSVDLAVAALNSPSADDRTEALITLTQTDNSAALEALVAAMEHDIRDVREQAAIILSARHEMRAIPYLINMLKEESDNRSQAKLIDALGNYESEARDAIPQLIHHLRHSRPNVRDRAAWALGTIGEFSWDAIPDLIESLRHQVSRVRGQSAMSLRRITGHDYGQEVQAWSEWWNHQTPN